MDLFLTLLRLTFLLLRLSGFRLNGDRLPEGTKKLAILDAIARATKAIPLAVALRVLHLSPARYHAWKAMAPECLDDRTSCPKTAPTQVAATEIRVMHDMVTDPAYRHIPITALARLAQRAKKVFVSAGTWYRVVREHGWERPRRRVYPAKPKVGLRATKPNEYWHIDVTVLKLLDGTRVYIHGVIDNYSRKILSWKVALKLEVQTTVDVLAEAAKLLGIDVTPTVITDAGVENLNATVDKFIADGHLRRLVAQVDITFSNSMIEAWWRCLKHQWLYLNQLDSLAAVEKLVAFYVEQHNSVIPHSAFDGQTPDEVYTGTGSDIPAQLAESRRLAREARIAANKALTCAECRPPPTGSTGPASVVNSGVLQLHQVSSGMS